MRIPQMLPSHNLEVHSYRPVGVTEMIGLSSIRLEFQQDIKTHPVVHVEHTKPAP